MGFDDIDRQYRAKQPEAEPECEKCFGSGWECYGIGHHDPHFRKCDVCHNPEGLPSP